MLYFSGGKKFTVFSYEIRKIYKLDWLKKQKKAYLTETRPIRIVRIIVRASLLNIIRTQIAHNIKNSIQLERKA